MKRIIKIISAIIITFLFCGTIQAAEIILSYGEDTTFPLSNWRSPGVSTHTLELEVRKPWKEGLDIAVASDLIWSETAPGHFIDGVYFEGTDTGLILSARLVAHKMVSKRIFIEGCVGFGWMTPNRQPEMGDSGVAGHFGGNIGYEFGEWAIIYGIIRRSDPYNSHDKGHNNHLIGIRYIGKKKKEKKY